MSNATPSQNMNADNSSTAQGAVAEPRMSIDWYRSIPWWRLLSHSVGISWRASHLMLAAVALWVTYMGWRLSEQAFAPEDMACVPFSATYEQVPTLIERIESWWRSPPFLNNAFDRLTVRRLAYSAFGVLWTIGVWSFAGGLLARRSLMEMGIRSSVGWGPSCRLICKRWLSMVWGISMPMAAIVGLALFPLALGMIARLGVIGQTIALVLMIPTVLLSIGIGWCAAISAFGFPLSICAIVAEKNADAFDGVSRSAAYVFQRPMTVLAILFLACGLAWLGDSIIRAVLSSGEQLLWAAFSIGFGGHIQDQIHDANPLLKNLLSLTKSIIPALEAAFLCSFFWSAAAAAYLTLRWEIDHTDFDDLDLQELGEPVALPQFKQDARGVAEIVEPSNVDR